MNVVHQRGAAAYNEPSGREGPRPCVSSEQTLSEHEGMRMDRRTFNTCLGTAVLAPLLSPASSANERGGRKQQSAVGIASPERSESPATPIQIGMLLYPGMYALDLVGPHAFLAGLPNAETHLLWKTLEPIAAINQMRLLPSLRLADCPKQLDVLFVPGGTPGTVALMQDDEVLEFLADRGARARYVTSVCTGSLVLGAAGLLRGYKATSHWHKRDLLALLGAVPVQARIVEDRNRITGGGVTSGIDFGLVLAARLRGVEAAKLQQLINEYDPHPPFDAGTPEKAGADLSALADHALSEGYAQSRAAALNARRRLGLA